MRKKITTKDLNCFETRFYLVPKEQLCVTFTSKVYEALQNLEDFKLDNLSEKAITEKIEEYNKAKENNFFDRLKAKDFLLAEANIHKIGKYKFAKINLMDTI